MASRSGRDTGVKDNWKCIAICLAMSLANCQYGYDTATISGFQAMPGFLKVYGYPDKKAKIGWNIATTPQQLISSFLNIGTIIGVVLTHLWARRFGRKAAIWAASFISFVAAGLQIGTDQLVGLYFGRILIGVSNGFFITFANVYTAEASPAHLRGPIVSFFGIWVSIGSMLGAVANNASKDFPTKLAYRIPLASLYAIPFFLSVLVFFLPESPRWLLVQGRDEEARTALARLRGASFKGKEELLEEEFLEMQRGIMEEKELAGGNAFKDMFRGADLRRTLICFGVILSHSSSGIWLIIGYGTFFFQMAGVDKPFTATILKSLMGLLGVLLSIVLNYRTIGRRFSMLLGHGGSVVFMLGMGIAASISGSSKEAGKAIVACALCWFFVYNGFSGAVSWPIANEVVSSRLRVATIGMGTGINYVFAWLTSFTTPYFINSKELNWGAKVAYIWAASNAITFVYFYFMLPEMRGRSLEEIDELFQNKVPTRDFSKYHCVSAERAREQAVKNTEVAEEDAGDEKTAETEKREVV
ncbi:MFS transporter [Lentithecium fluviatile CBS 122367]|uniref:MFS transporter n=1 Tax=Lentithecium fluviatile CBS 122367 TaxID=1168545 RepID=A0A6G1JGG5_9PLEO|nr:MFS transporter [Lentithecium fluviatile CBS 122367]